MALHSFNIKYRYNFIPLYNLTSLVFYFSLFISCVCFFLNRYDFMIHFGLSTYTFPDLHSYRGPSLTSLTPLRMLSQLRRSQRR